MNKICRAFFSNILVLVLSFSFANAESRAPLPALQLIEEVAAAAEQRLSDGNTVPIDWDGLEEARLLINELVIEGAMDLETLSKLNQEISFTNQSLTETGKALDSCGSPFFPVEIHPWNMKSAGQQGKFQARVALSFELLIEAYRSFNRIMDCLYLVRDLFAFEDVCLKQLEELEYMMDQPESSSMKRVQLNQEEIDSKAMLLIDAGFLPEKTKTRLSSLYLLTIQAFHKSLRITRFAEFRTLPSKNSVTAGLDACANSKDSGGQ